MATRLRCPDFVSSSFKKIILFFIRPRSEGWPHHGRTFSILSSILVQITHFNGVIQNGRFTPSTLIRPVPDLSAGKQLGSCAGASTAKEPPQTNSKKLLPKET